LSGGVHHWLKRRSTREERKPVTRNDNNNVSEQCPLNPTAAQPVKKSPPMY
jgi:hypothetical protein